VKRWIFTILLFLLLVSGGAIVNVAVAWGCHWRATGTPGQRFSLDEDSAGMLFHRWGGQLTADEELWVDGERCAGRVSIVFFVLAPDRSSAPPEVLAIWEAGWPLRSLEGAQHWVKRGDFEERQRRNIMLWSPLGRNGGSSRLSLPLGWPLAPIWPGFVVDTLFYAVFLWLLIPGPFVLRRSIRVNRGRCPKCGYDLRGEHAAGCPEYGWGRELKEAV
jgi:hypothetical protein